MKVLSPVLTCVSPCFRIADDERFCFLSLPTFYQDGGVFGNCSLRAEEGLRNTAQLPTRRLHWNCNPTHLSNLRPISSGVFGGREDGRENCTKRGFTAFVGGGGEEEELLDEAASDGSVVGRLTEVSWQGWMAPAPPPAWLASQ